MFDVITLGETMLRLAPANNDLLERARQLDVVVGGSESNTAIALSQLGACVCWISRLPNNELGDLVTREISRYGVDTSKVVRADDERLGVFYYQPSKAPRSSSVIYDRADSAMTRFDEAQFDPSIIVKGAAKCFHATGITLAISECARKLCLSVMKKAQQAQMKVSFDINHRNKLWSYSEAKPYYEQAIKMADVVFVAQRDAHLLWPQYVDDKAQMDWGALRATFDGDKIWVITRGDQGAMAIDANGQLIEQGIFESVEIDRVGRGDAFSAGFLYQWINGADLSLGLKTGAALSAIKNTIAGDVAVFTKAELETIMDGDGAQTINR